jgi:hypothetical protein
LQKTNKYASSSPLPDGFTEGMYRLYRHLLDIHTRSFLFVVRPE